jgi:2'-5' RNA ligase
LLYDDRHLDNQPISPIRWWVREFVLVHSLLGRTHYNFLARFPLR